MALHDLPARAKDGFHVVVESPRGARVKLKYEPEHEALFLSRALPLGYTYPYDFGFVPGTEGPDGDPLDAVVYWDVPSVPGAVLRCRMIGVLELDQRTKRGERQRNDRLVAVPLGHHRGDDVASVLELAPRVREELAHFFTSSVYFSGKDARALRWRGPREARALVASGERGR
jgi:inorganic pyrophosphatase